MKIRGGEERRYRISKMKNFRTMRKRRRSDAECRGRGHPMKILAEEEGGWPQGVGTPWDHTMKEEEDGILQKE